MDHRIAMMLEKAKEVADKTGKAASRAVDSAGRAAGDMAQATRLNLQIFDLNTECDALYKKIGKLVYDIHKGREVASDEMDDQLAQLDDLNDHIEQLRAQLTDYKQTTVCPVCGKQCDKTDSFCSGCGAVL